MAYYQDVEHELAQKDPDRFKKGTRSVAEIQAALARGDGVADESDILPRDEPSAWGRNTGTTRVVGGVKKLGECGRCGKDLMSGVPVINAIGNKWHTKCFVCHADGCFKSLTGGTGFHTQGGVPVCDEHWTEKPAPKRAASAGPTRVVKSQGWMCEECGEEITGESPVVIKKKYYHQNCFTCYKCEKPVDLKAGWYQGKGGKPMCYYCREKPNVGLCTVQ